MSTSERLRTCGPGRARFWGQGKTGKKIETNAERCRKYFFWVGGVKATKNEYGFRMISVMCWQAFGLIPGSKMLRKSCKGDPLQWFASLVNFNELLSRGQSGVFWKLSYACFIFYARKENKANKNSFSGTMTKMMKHHSSWCTHISLYTKWSICPRGGSTSDQTIT